MFLCEYCNVFKNTFLQNTSRWLLLKGYLRYKTITSQNVPAEAQIKNFFIS